MRLRPARSGSFDVRPGAAPLFGAIPVERALGRRAFTRRYLARNRPVVAASAIRDWPAMWRWKPTYLRSRLGSLKVSVSGDFFHPLCLMQFSEFLDLLDDYERRQEWDLSQHVPYMRFSYPEAGSDDFEAACFEELRDDWERPAFLPRRGYVSPFDPLGTSPTRRRYPEWGVLVSPRGAVTRAHIDRFNDNAVLCNVRGRKRAFLFPPRPDVLRMLDREFQERERGAQVPKTREAVALLSGASPCFGALPVHEAELGPGDVLFIPKRWAHEVYTLTMSISLTYNFVHVSDVDLAYLWLLLTGRGYH